MSCKRCNRPNCIGYQLLHKEGLVEVPERKKILTEKYGDVEFDLIDSPSSGEIFTKFYELHLF
ncbi:hypothetical protein D3C81_808770 [compost metagenome]